MLQKGRIISAEINLHFRKKIKKNIFVRTNIIQHVIF